MQISAGSPPISARSRRLALSTSGTRLAVDFLLPRRGVLAASSRACASSALNSYTSRARTSDATPISSSPARGSSFNPAMRTGVAGPAELTRPPLSLSIAFTLPYVRPATTKSDGRTLHKADGIGTGWTAAWCLRGYIRIHWTTQRMRDYAGCLPRCTSTVATFPIARCTVDSRTRPSTGPSGSACSSSISACGDHAAAVPQMSRRDRAEITPSRGCHLQQDRLVQRVKIRSSGRAHPDDGHVATQVLGKNLSRVCQADGSRVGRKPGQGGIRASPRGV